MYYSLKENQETELTSVHNQDFLQLLDHVMILSSFCNIYAWLGGYWH